MRGRWTNALYTSLSRAPQSRECPRSFRRAVASTSDAVYASPSRRRLSTHPARRQAFPASGVASTHAEADAKLLRELFDAPGLARKSSLLTESATASTGSTGLFQSESMRSIESFEQLAKTTLLRCQLIVSRIQSAPQNGPQEMRRVVRQLDRLSDLLCGIIDCAELVRNAHPDRKWVECANNVYESLCGYMNELNTHTGLYEVLAQVLSDESLRNDLSQEALAVAYVFLRDFEKSGIHLPEAQRARFVRLSDEILVLGRSFLQNGGESEGEAVEEMPVEWLEGAPSTIVEALQNYRSNAKGKLRLPHNSWGMQIVSKYVPDDRARRLAYIGMNTGTPEQVQTLELLLQRRAELARLTGSDNFASMTLADKMARKPENVNGFLSSLDRHHRTLAERDLDQLRALKMAEKGTRDLNAWDRDYYNEKHIRNMHLKSTAPPIGGFFSVGTVFAGLSRLFERLYGITLRAAPAQKGETWAEDVCRMDVIEDGHKIGTIYADLYNRPGKPPSAAHYTVRCSRRTDDDDELGDFFYGRLSNGQQITQQDGAELSTLDSHPVRLPNRQGEYQLPIVVLLFDFVRPSTATQPSLLSWQEVETLFHEMGHAIHSMIGRTEYHNVSGTRCATDFVELPSILMEHFVSSPDVVELVARHHRTDASLPYAHLQAHLQVQRSLDSLETHSQIMLATLDQLYHAAPPSDGRPIDSTETWFALQRRIGLIPPVQGTSWQVHFSHLFGYGATYYTYLFDRAIASRIWQRLFRRAPLNREAGEAFKTRVLSHGGGRDPWAMLADVLQDDDLVDGADNAKAMQAVGRWGIGDVDAKL